MNEQLRNTIHAYLANGLCALPATTEKKCPVGSWKEFQTRRPTDSEVDMMLEQHPEANAIAIICGSISGNLEVIDFDWHGYHTDDWAEALQDCGVELSNLCMEETQNKGYHIAYRSSTPVEKNTKLTNHIFSEDELDFANGKAYYSGKEIVPNGKGQYAACTIETRGEGGLIICAPSQGYELLPVGKSWLELPVISQGQIDMFKTMARSLDNTGEQVKEQPLPKPEYHAPAWGKWMASDYVRNLAFSASLLSNFGWKFAYSYGGDEAWTRPGKDHGASAILHSEGNVHVFTTSVPDLPAGDYSAMQLFRQLYNLSSDSEASRAIFEYAKQQGDIPTKLTESTIMNSNLNSIDCFGVQPISEEEVDNLEKKNKKQVSKKSYTELPKAVRDYLQSNKSQFLGPFFNRMVESTGLIQPELFFCSGLATLAFLTSKHVYAKIYNKKSRSNVNMCLVADSASGKTVCMSHAQQCIAEFLKDNSTKGYIADSFESQQAIHNAYYERGELCFWKRDEFHSWLASAINGKAQMRAEVLSKIITEHFGYQNKHLTLSDSLGIKKFNRQCKKDDGVERTQDYLCNLTMLVGSQPNNMIKFITSRAEAESGTLSRILICMGRPIEEATANDEAVVDASYDLSPSDYERPFINYWKGFNYEFPGMTRGSSDDAGAGDFAEFESNEGLANANRYYDGKEEGDGYLIPTMLDDPREVELRLYRKYKKNIEEATKKFGKGTAPYVLSTRLTQYVSTMACLIACDRVAPQAGHELTDLVIDEEAVALAEAITDWFYSIQANLWDSKEANRTAEGDEAVTLCRAFLERFEKANEGDEWVITKSSLCYVRGCRGAKARKLLIETLDSMDAIRPDQRVVDGSRKKTTLYIVDVKKIRDFVD